MQSYIEKWLQIIYRITGIAPPAPGPQLIRRLDEMFLELQQPFEASKCETRKNVLNYNYVFCRHCLPWAQTQLERLRTAQHGDNWNNRLQQQL